MLANVGEQYEVDVEMRYFLLHLQIDGKEHGSGISLLKLETKLVYNFTCQIVVFCADTHIINVSDIEYHLIKGFSIAICHILPDDNVFCRDLRQLPLAEIRNDLLMDDSSLGKRSIQLEPGLDALFIQSNKALKSHIDVVCFLHKNFPFLDLILFLGGRSLVSTSTAAYNRIQSAYGAKYYPPTDVQQQE